MMRGQWRMIGGALIMALLLVVGASYAQKEAEKPADFYKRKNLDWTIPTTAGSGTDLVGRAAAEFFSRETGATAIVTNRVGAGGGEGYNWIYQARPDGLTIGTVTYVATVLNKIMQSPGFNYDFEKFNYLFGVNLEGYMFFVSPKGPYKSIADLKAAKNLKFCGTSTSGFISLGSMLVAYLLDLDAKVVTGYKYSAIGLAVAQGEIAGFVLNRAAASPMVDAGQIKPLFLLAPQRDPGWPDVPAITELASLSVEKKGVLEKAASVTDTYLSLTSPGVPEARVKYLRDTGNKVMATPEFRAAIEKILGRKVTHFFSGEALQKRAAESAKVSAELRSIFDKIVKQYAVTL